MHRVSDEKGQEEPRKKWKRKRANCTRAAFRTENTARRVRMRIRGSSQEAPEKDAPLSAFANAVNRASLYVTRHRPMFSNLRRMNASLYRLVGREFTSDSRCIRSLSLSLASHRDAYSAGRNLDINQRSARAKDAARAGRRYSPSLFRRSRDAMNRKRPRMKLIPRS